MKLIRNIAFSLATFIVLLHALIPHEHHSSEKNLFIAHHEPASLVDQIALGFHLSQSDGHLENFSAENALSEIQQPQLLAVLATAVFEIRPALISADPEAVYAEPENTFKSLNVSLFPHRGPPVL